MAHSRIEQLFGTWGDCLEEVPYDEPLNSLAQHIGAKKRIALLRDFDRLVFEAGPHMAFFLEDFLGDSFTESSNLDLSLAINPHNQPLFQKLAESEAAANLVNALSKEPKGIKTRYVLGQLLATFGKSHLPQETKGLLQAIPSDTKTTIKPSHNGWDLCNLSEKHLEHAMEDGQAVLVNDFLLTKSIDYVTALCIKTTTVDRGTFLAGSWYSPTEKDLRDQIRKVDPQIFRVEIPTSQWAYMRDVTATWANKLNPLLQRSRNYAEALPAPVSTLS